MTETAKAGLFYVIAFALALLAAWLCAQPGQEAAIMLYMASPLVAVLIMQLIATREGWSVAGWRDLAIRQPGIRFWTAAVVLPLVALAAGWGLTLLSGAGFYKAPPDGQSLAAFIAAAPLGMLSGMILAFGEEAGWRGYLLPKLLPIGLWPALLVSGFLHGAWHLPLILMTPFYHTDGSRLIVLPAFLLLLTLAGVFYGLIRLASASLWPVVIAHAAFNEALERIATITGTDSPERLEYLGGESGLFTLLGTAAVVATTWYWLAPQRNSFSAPS